jgi:4-amino-4-deoxy-L-arabinose transferase-like glycosyltransferase
LRSSIQRFFETDFLGFLEKKAAFFYILILGLTAFHLFFRLGSGPVFEWDEARHGLNAFEMLQNGQYSFTTYQNTPDLWNLKPPLGAWAITLSYRIFGVNLFALRFFSAFLSLLIVAGVIAIAHREWGKAQAVCSGFILASTTPFFALHSGRTGDFTAMLGFFFFLSLFALVMTHHEKPFLFLAGLAFAGASLSYSFSAFLIPAWGIPFLIATGFWRRLSPRDVFVLVATALLPIAIWAIVRYGQPSGPEFLSKMFLYDLVKRSTQPIEEHYSNAFNYLKTLLNHNGAWTVWALVILPLSARWSRWPLRKPLFAAALLACAIPLLLFSAAQTRLGWYINPIYPPLALLLGWATISVLRNDACRGNIRVFLVSLLFLFFLYAEGTTLYQIQRIGHSSSQTLLSHLKAQNVPAGKSILIHPCAQNDRYVAQAFSGLEVHDPNDPDEWDGKDFWLLRDGTETRQIMRQKGYELLRKDGEWLLAAPRVH